MPVYDKLAQHYPPEGGGSDVVVARFDLEYNDIPLRGMQVGGVVCMSAACRSVLW
jgi:hypothetical protein